MLAITLVFSSMFFIISLIVGGLVGWAFNEHSKNNQQYYMHPEMFDSNGNVIPDEVIAFRFEGYDEHQDEDEEEESKS